MRKKRIANSIQMLSKVRLTIIFTLIIILLLINFYILFGMRKFYILTSTLGTNNIKPQKAIESMPKIHELMNENSNDSLKNSDTELIYRNKCPNFGEAIKLVIVVTSSPKNAKSREIIRRTWGSFATRNDIALVFNIGNPKDENLNQKIKEEQDLYDDIIRGTFLDIYTNLTLKTTWMLEWVTKYCLKALFLLKVDDDVFINIELLLNFINEKKIIKNRSIYGRVVNNWHPAKNEEDKYYTALAQYGFQSLPSFTTGPAYLLPADLAGELYNEAVNMEYGKLEDVFYTGIVASRLNIPRIHVPEFANKWIDMSDCSLKKTISVHGAPGEYINYMWFRINSISSEDCGG